MKPSQGLNTGCGPALNGGWGGGGSGNASLGISSLEYVSLMEISFVNVNYKTTYKIKQQKCILLMYLSLSLIIRFNFWYVLFSIKT